jgi:hypothetical protein
MWYCILNGKKIFQKIVQVCPVEKKGRREKKLRQNLCFTLSFVFMFLHNHLLFKLFGYNDKEHIEICGSVRRLIHDGKQNYIL